MELIFRPRFKRDMLKIKNKEVLQKIAVVLHQTERAKSKEEIGGLVKLEKYEHY